MTSKKTALSVSVAPTISIAPVAPTGPAIPPPGTNLEISLVSTANKLPYAMLFPAVQAFNLQISRDVAKYYDTRSAVVVAREKESDVPPGAWAIFIKDDISDPGALGVHLDDTKGLPYALVQFDADWTVTVSHELIEMIGDPMGNYLVRCASPANGVDQVECLRELCDPCEQQTYSIGDTQVAAFIRPNWHADVFEHGTAYSFPGFVEAPRSLCPGGYVSFRILGTDHWFQLFADSDGNLSITDLGSVAAEHGSLRSLVAAAAISKAGKAEQN